MRPREVPAGRGVRGPRGMQWPRRRGPGPGRRRHPSLSTMGGEAGPPTESVQNKHINLTGGIPEGGRKREKAGRGVLWKVEGRSATHPELGPGFPWGALRSHTHPTQRGRSELCFIVELVLTSESPRHAVLLSEARPLSPSGSSRYWPYLRLLFQSGVAVIRAGGRGRSFVAFSDYLSSIEYRSRVRGHRGPGGRCTRDPGRSAPAIAFPHRGAPRPAGSHP